MRILVTGTAGFIGFHLAQALIMRGEDVIGLDNINNYYDVNLKYGRLAVTGIEQEVLQDNRIIKSKKYENYRFIKLNLEDTKYINTLFKEIKFDAVCHLAAQAGVRYSLTNPYAYINSNILGFINILEGCRNNSIKNLCYASSSSVYGINKHKPFSTSHNVDHPISLYAATKKSNELMAHTYSYLYNIPSTGLRFFTVYGPWGRPDMALYIFVKNIIANKPIDVYNYGNMSRDFTYIDDIIEGVIRVIDNPAEPVKDWDKKKGDAACSIAPYRIYNIGNGKPVPLTVFIRAIEKVLGKKAITNMLPIQPGDVPETFADTGALERDFGYKPEVEIDHGIKEFVKWYIDYYS